MPGTVRVDEALLKRTVADTIRYTLTRPTMIVVWVLVAFSLTAFAVVASLDGSRFGELWWLGLVLIVLTASLVALTVLPIRRALRLGMPVGSELSASVAEGVLRMDAAQGRSEIRLDALKRARLAGETVIVQLKGTPTASAVPRRLLSDEELADLGVAAR